MSLSLCLIVKNEEDVLARALSTAAIYADEIIIADTGSTDGTKSVARKFTDKVFDFKWTDDFSAARNYAVSKASCDHWMWLDADDIVPADSARGIKNLMRSSGGADIIMLPYVLDGAFSFYRERIISKKSGLRFFGRVHEAVELKGTVIRRAPAIYHAKPADRTHGSRNLNIYKAMIADGDPFSPRDKYYYARELFYAGEYNGAERAFRAFLDGGGGAGMNCIDACVMLSRCAARLNKNALPPLFESFNYGVPTGEACCEIGLIYISRGDYRSAAYWLERAASLKPDYNSGAFIDRDCYGFLPCVWLTVCYDRLGDKKRAYRWHLRAKKYKPDHPSVRANDKYFSALFDTK